jgi:penicillin-binding protein 1A
LKVGQVRAVLLRGWWLILACLVALGALAAFMGLLRAVPLPNAAPEAQSSLVYDANGQVMGSFHGEQNRTIVPLSDISMNLRQAVVATEDRGFYTHPGVSLRGIIRAAFVNLRGGGIEQGASTITQQYARTFTEIGKQRTLARKLKEATLAVKLERRYSKDKILEFYLNTVYFGRGAYGAEAAAQTYFKKPAKDLDLPESAYLAGIIRSPQRYQVEKNPQGVVNIKNEVLKDMVTAGYITTQTKLQAEGMDVASHFRFGLNAEQDSPRAGYFIEYVRKLLLSPQYGLTEKDLLGGGLKIYTTLDLKMQDAAEAAVSSTMNLPTDPEVALLAMDPLGQVRAMVGGRVVNDVTRARGFNFAANVDPKDGGGRQPGSAFKPIALAAFVDSGKSIRSSFEGPSHIEITSKTCRNADGTPWEVSNFENAGYGVLDMVDATTHSVNTIYAQVMDKVVTPQRFMDMADKAGISIPEVDRGCALTLGTTDVTPMEMARAYTTFANHGKRPEPLTVLKVISPDGKLLIEKKPRLEQTIDPNVADTVAWILKQNIDRGTGTGAKLPWPAMGKTGTAQNHQDASFAGATPELTAVVWMGYPPDKANGNVIPTMQSVHGRKVTGGSFPATIWKKFMQVALKDSKHSGFVTPKITGEVLSPPPPPCGTVLGPDGLPLPGQSSNGQGLNGQGADGQNGTGNQGVQQDQNGNQIQTNPDCPQQDQQVPLNCQFPFNCPDQQNPNPDQNQNGDQRNGGLLQNCPFPFNLAQCLQQQQQQNQKGQKGKDQIQGSPTPTPTPEASPSPTTKPSPPGCEFPFCTANGGNVSRPSG